ncbi:MAG: DNA repair protein RadA [Bacillota bacterium]|nr:DNA repair protein RadA [Bacillota bacterium]
MPKERSAFVCQNCGYSSLRWMGRCPDCGSWNTLVEERQEPKRRASSGRAVAGREEGPVPIDSVEGDAGDRLSSGVPELDRVLGGGIVRGSLVLVGGDPGVGKSTLLLQAASAVACQGTRVLYVSGEESAAQTKMRAQRIGALSPNLLVSAETDVAEIERHLSAHAPALAIVDSIQTMHISELESSPGSVTQVRESAARFLGLAKGLGISVFLVGHMTKSGSIAGPRVLEHIVDTVLYFEGEGSSSYRILRAIKNRFGSTNEIGVFEMGEKGLEGVTNPSAMFLDGRPEGVSGSAVAACSEGTRPVLVEVQALVTRSTLGMPRRMAQGLDNNRLSLLLAVLEKRAGLELGTYDVYLKIAGGLRVSEPGIDLPVAVAVASAFLEKTVNARTVLFGEVGLGGEIRATPRVEERLTEALRMGFDRCVTAQAGRKRTKHAEGGITLVPVRDIRSALVEALDRTPS